MSMKFHSKEHSHHEQKKKNFAILANHLKNNQKDNVTFGMFDIKEFDIDMAHGCANQIILLMKNGKFEVMPPKINAASLIRDHIGLRFNRIVKWGPLPCVNNPGHPMQGKPMICKLTLDIYLYAD